ncbi:XRE family transcriptional regulator [Pseudomonas poae]|nr:XRE family transcriptional regulator [Pseudomonas poae]
MSEDSFAFRLKELLEHKKLTLQAVAGALCVSRTAVHKWTRGGKSTTTTCANCPGCWTSTGSGCAMAHRPSKTCNTARRKRCP